METTIRLANPQTDFPQIATLLSQHGRESVTADELHEADMNKAPQTTRRHVIAANSNSNNEIVGYCVVVHYASAPSNHYELTLIVHPRYRRQGIGMALYQETLTHLQQQGVVHLTVEVDEHDADALQFAQKRGFHIILHELASRLDLNQFNNQPFAHLIPQLKQKGICFFSYADTTNSLTDQKQLYAINRIATLDDPGSTGAFADFSTWQRIVVQASWFQPKGQWLAADGDKVIGLSAAIFDTDRRVVETALTGIHPDYRGRGIATALKLCIIRFAQEQGATHIVTENDSRNQAMLAINQKLGFQPQAGGYYRLAFQFMN